MDAFDMDTLLAYFEIHPLKIRLLIDRENALAEIPGLTFHKYNELQRVHPELFVKSYLMHVETIDTFLDLFPNLHSREVYYQLIAHDVDYLTNLKDVVAIVERMTSGVMIQISPGVEARAYANRVMSAYDDIFFYNDRVIRMQRHHTDRHILNYASKILSNSDGENVIEAVDAHVIVNRSDFDIHFLAAMIEFDDIISVSVSVLLDVLINLADYSGDLLSLEGELKKEEEINVWILYAGYGPFSLGG